MTEHSNKMHDFVGEHGLLTSSFELDEKPCFRANSLVEELVYCAIPSNYENGIHEGDLIVQLGYSDKLQDKELGPDHVKQAIADLINGQWICRPPGGEFLYRTNFDRSIQLRFL